MMQNAANGGGRLIGIGLGPGDPELISLKGLRALQSADCLVFHQAAGKKSHALGIAEPYLKPEQSLLPLIYPMTVENPASSAAYKAALAQFYRLSAAAVRARLAAGETVAILAEGDPLFYSSFMYLYDALNGQWETEIIPGISSVAAASAAIGAPLCRRSQILQILPATLPEEALRAALAAPGEKAFAFIKLGRNLGKIRRLLREAALFERAFYVENASARQEFAAPLKELAADYHAPYFSIILAPGQQAPARETAPAKPRGKISVIGLGPGAAALRAARADKALREADAVLGYQFYLDQAAPYAAHQQIIASDNRQELERARAALALARQGRHAALLSSGDAGVFGMAAAFFEVYERQTPQEPEPEISVEAGVSAAFAAGAHFGAPLGHDFAVISLSDNLKPWAVIEARLAAAAKTDMVMALYNPVSKARRQQLSQALALLKSLLPAETYIGLAHDAERESARYAVTRLGALEAEEVTSRTVMIIGSSKTRYFEKGGRGWLYTPRRYDEG